MSGREREGSSGEGEGRIEGAGVRRGVVSGGKVRRCGVMKTERKCIGSLCVLSDNLLCTQL